MIQTRARRTVSALALLLAAGLPQTVTAAQPKESTPALDYEPAESLEGNFLSAYIAGAARDTAAAASFYREAVKADPRNAELVEPRTSPRRCSRPGPMPARATASARWRP